MPKPIRRVAVFGGTFNPPHRGHLHLARLLLQAVKPDLLLVIPDHLPPHKAADGLAEGAQRMAMCRLAFAPLAPCVVSAREILRTGRSYTADTLAELAALYPGTELFFLCGGDMFLTVQDWARPEEIFVRATLCAAARTEGEAQALACHAARLEREFGARSCILQGEVLDVSSSALRRRIAAGEPADGLLAPAVEAYIQKNGLYRDA